MFKNISKVQYRLHSFSPDGRCDDFTMTRKQSKTAVDVRKRKAAPAATQRQINQTEEEASRTTSYHRCVEVVVCLKAEGNDGRNACITS